MKSNKLNIFICLSCSALIVGFLFFSAGFKTLTQHMHTLNWGWLGAAVGCMLLYWLFESLALHCMLKPMHKEQTFLNSVRITMGGQYFSSITPFSTGGQPFQAYCLTKQGMDLGVAIHGLLAKFILYQAALVAVSTVLLVLRLAYFQQQVNHFTFVVLLGFTINLLVMFAILCFAVFPRVARWFSCGIIRILAKLRLIKEPEATVEYMTMEIDRCNACFHIMRKNLPAMLGAFLLSVAQLLVFMAVPYMIYRAFDLREIDLLTIVAAQAFVMMMAAFVPLPGASIGAEGFFYFFFAQFFYEVGQLGLALILWRLITFYFTIVVGACFAVRANRKPKAAVSA